MKNKIFTLAAAAVLVAAAVLYGIFAGPVKNIKTDVVVFGDSLIGNDRTEDSVTAQLSKLSGLSVYNAGIGGTAMNAGSEEISRFKNYNMVSIATDIANDDFSAMLSDIPTAYIQYSNVLDYAADTIKDIARIDYDSVKYVVIEHGVNDYLGGVALDNSADRYDTATFCGALRTSIENLKKAMPDAQIIVVSPCFTWTQVGPADTTDLGYGTIDSYVEAERAVCEEEDVTFADFYNESGINRKNYEAFLYDSLHVNEAGSSIMADIIYKNMKSH
ncbi:MAG: SGNH/GDSL hydrolase family protein [Lachnospiraceae bacterium]|nr:SGNH/GDSL hydrolase family protein [Lachnospiraceae bacterium]